MVRTSNEIADLVYKALIWGRVQGSASALPQEENIPLKLDVHGDDIYVNSIPSTPPSATTGVIKKHYPSSEGGDDWIVLSKDSKYNGNRVWVALPTWSSSFSSGSGDLTQIMTNFVAPKYGVGYKVKLYDVAGNEIPELDQSDWVFYYKAGVLVFNMDRVENGSSEVASIKIKAFQYIGLMASGISGTTYDAGQGITINSGTNPDTINVNLATDSGLEFFSESSVEKLRINSTLRSNWDTAYAWGNHAEAGYLTNGVDASFQTIETVSDAIIGGDLTVSGNLAVNGTTFTSNAETVQVSDNIMVLNYGEVGGGVTAGSAGIEIERGSAVNYQFIFDESTDSFKIGEIGSLQKVATREDSPTNNYFAKWNSTTNRFDTAQINISNDTNLSVNSTNLSLSSSVLNTIQDIATTSNPRFASLGIGRTPTQELDVYSASPTLLLEATSGNPLIHLRNSGGIDWQIIHDGSNLEFRRESVEYLTLSSGAVTVTGTASITSNATVGGTLGVTGNSTLTGSLTINGGAFNLNSAGNDVLNYSSGTLRINSYTTIGEDIPVFTVGNDSGAVWFSGQPVGLFWSGLDVGSGRFNFRSEDGYDLPVGASYFFGNGSQLTALNANSISTGTLGGARGGTGITTFGAANRIPYAASTTALTTSTNFAYNGTTLTIANTSVTESMNIGNSHATGIAILAKCDNIPLRVQNFAGTKYLDYYFDGFVSRFPNGSTDVYSLITFPTIGSFGTGGGDIVLKPDNVERLRTSRLGKLTITTDSTLGSEALNIIQNDTGQAFINFQGNDTGGLDGSIATDSSGILSATNIYLKFELNGSMYFFGPAYQV